jgi:Mg2+ and Co2+ transporter CorA
VKNQTRPHTIQEEIADRLEDIAHNLAELVQETKNCSDFLSALDDTASQIVNEIYDGIHKSV